MALVESLQKAIDYMEEHLLEQLTIEVISKQANLSPFHFQRTFMILTDLTVGDYLRRRRLTLAAQELTARYVKLSTLPISTAMKLPKLFQKLSGNSMALLQVKLEKGSESCNLITA